ncbi:DUF2950 domain-containing protein [Bradyrhizobium guangdongense]|uniref:DUF2950 domain-containing protein n=1 Tax=Bradyrhizobium guangdongense TaxID=1325090 RepID=A0A410V1V0_9BRAD|nr:DUF2950 domain-containing protein [Bradyrhizobium guangdongense]QAU37681.1 DUF2950 domain-containing protein [Bradyrhizobium guangdongense]QOZ58739.1 DUF2950 domain-containing protein [Bradyrhizobium guangdongense]GGI19777.1 hypothetical protein GCM10010987_06050 [Bradyrhizobium guangdongense]
MISLKSLQRAVLPGMFVFALLGSVAQAQQSYKTPEDAAAALAAAVKSGPRDTLKVLGRAAEDIVSSGDEVADNDIRQRFSSMYEAKHGIKAEGNKSATLILGADDFPFPIPLVNTKAGWEFDTDEGRIEVLRRRIGRNELDAIQTALAFVDAQNEYADKDRGEGVGVYAQHIMSSPGKKDGLFWRDDNDPSPLGPLAAQASSEGYKAGESMTPYHGYYFRILKGQGPDAPGGALNYVVKGKMIGGFALIAWPAEYGNSGVMTFLVNHAGVVYQKDLGKRTDFVAKRLTLFDPDQTWKKVDAAKP